MKTFVGILMAGFVISASAQTPAGEPNVDNRKISSNTEGGRNIIHLDEGNGAGIAWWPKLVLSDGAIEFDVRGKNLPQRSFVGIAFHGKDGQNYDAVYLRPFNFRAADAVARGHAVQYISIPDHDWQKLRTEHPGQYEQPITPPPDPDQWVHVRIVIAYPKVSTYIDGATEPALTVNQLSDRKTGWVGFWVGNGSAGDFANLKITASER